LQGFAGPGATSTNALRLWSRTSAQNRGPVAERRRPTSIVLLHLHITGRRLRLLVPRRLRSDGGWRREPYPCVEDRVATLGQQICGVLLPLAKRQLFLQLFLRLWIALERWLLLSRGLFGRRFLARASILLLRRLLVLRCLWVCICIYICIRHM